MRRAGVIGGKVSEKQSIELRHKWLYLGESLAAKLKNCKTNYQETRSVYKRKVHPTLEFRCFLIQFMSI